MSLLEKLLDLVESTAPEAKPVWTNKVMVPFLVNGGKTWAWVHTKKAEMVQLDLKVPKHQVTLGSIRQLGIDPEIHGDDPNHDIVSLKFRLLKELKIGRLRNLLKSSLKAAE
jgi:hypothetical protein